MPFRDTILGHPRPASIRPVALPRRDAFHPSPVDWRNEVLYFLLPDRFSDGQDKTRPLLDRSNLAAARPASFKFNQWAESGDTRFQGGTIAGISSRLDYLETLGVTTIWVGPVFKQRGHQNTYHGYAIQDFLEVDPRFGTRQDLVDLVTAAHGKKMRVILDIIFNHSGHNWDYEGGQENPPFRPWPGFYNKGDWIDAAGHRSAAIGGDEDGVWPTELQGDDNYTRAGKGSLSGEDIDNDRAEMKRTDFDGSMRDFNFDGSNTLNDLARCYKYWIALTDCDGFRIDTLKHVSLEAARNFCGTVKEFAANLGKQNFFLVGEVGGPENNAGRYLDVLELNLNATLDIGETRPALLPWPRASRRPPPTSTSSASGIRSWARTATPGVRHVTVLDDHDQIFGDKTRFSSDASPAEHQVVAGVAIQLFTLGIPCIYYGTEQAFAGPPNPERDQFLPDYNKGSPPPDKYLREIMFGAEHPRKSGRDGLPSAGAAGFDTTIPAFGAFGTVGHQCFDPDSPAFVRIRHLIGVRQQLPVLRYGRQYLRPIAPPGGAFDAAKAGDIIAWSRILDDEEVLCVVNGNGGQSKGGDVIVEGSFNAAPGAAFQVLANSAQAARWPRGCPTRGLTLSAKTPP